jgi:hypothetical protein
MWLFTRYGFYSIASARQPNGSLDTQTVMIRARRVAHLTNLQKRFPALAVAEILTFRNRDYCCRLIVSKEVWVGIVSQLAQEQEWSNFKNEVAEYQGKADSDYVHALHEVWSVMFTLQKKTEPFKEQTHPGAVTPAVQRPRRSS